jgi:hypothetical protein
MSFSAFARRYLTESRLISFLPANDMLKFTGLSNPKRWVLNTFSNSEVDPSFIIQEEPDERLPMDF